MYRMFFSTYSVCVQAHEIVDFIVHNIWGKRQAKLETKITKIIV
jgi:hypothetical protein